MLSALHTCRSNSRKIYFFPFSATRKTPVNVIMASVQLKLKFSLFNVHETTPLLSFISRVQCIYFISIFFALILFKNLHLLYIHMYITTYNIRLFLTHLYINATSVIYIPSVAGVLWLYDE